MIVDTGNHLFDAPINSCHCQPLEALMPDSDAEVLEALLASVMRLVSMHLDAPITHVAPVPLSAAEGSLIVELLGTGDVTQQQIADRLSIDKSRVSRLCATLEHKHLVARERDDSNRRNLRVQLTDSGKEAATRLRHAWRTYHEQMLTAMTPDERRGLLLGLTAFAREISAAHPEPAHHRAHHVHHHAAAPDASVAAG
jgi:DNA-binding MarR family transcriptional regulator